MTPHSPSQVTRACPSAPAGADREGGEGGGAGGPGALPAAELATFDWAAGATVLAAVVALTGAVDVVSDRARAALR